MSHLPMLLLQIGLIPLLFSALIWMLRLVHPQSHGDDTSEKLFLLAMLTSVLGGLILPQIAGVLPSAPIRLPEWSGMNGELPPVVTDHEPRDSIDLLTLAPSAIFLIYIAGLLISGARFLTSVFQLLQIERSARPANNREYWTSPADISAIASISGRIIISDHLVSQLQPAETDFIIAHERAHIERRDPVLFLTLSFLDALFWFNPFLRQQTDRCRHAAELACDARIVGKEAPKMRSAYASTLLNALEHTAGNARPCVPAAFSRQTKGDYRMRIENIMQPKHKIGKSAHPSLVAALAALILPLGAAQLALAETPASFSMSSLPVDGKLTSTFGLRTHPITKEMKHHDGIDIAAPNGTKVVSPSAGTVIGAEFRTGFGNLVTIDHGNGMVTRYAQLDKFSVKVGDHVSKGMKIGEVGATGKYATGPHLHFEILQNGEHVDPQSFLQH